jgi:hypothetical protein
MKITQANLEFIRNDVYLNLTALVPLKSYNSWYLKKNNDVQLANNINNKILDFTFCCDQNSIVDKLNFKAKTIRQKVAINKWFNGLKVNIAGDKEVVRLHKACLKQEPIGFDDFDFNLIAFRDNTLHITTSYEGGQEPHAFQLNWDGNVKYNGVIQVALEMTHNSNNDQGTENQKELLQFDLGALFLMEEKMRIIIKSAKKISIITHNP